MSPEISPQGGRDRIKYFIGIRQAVIRKSQDGSGGSVYRIAKEMGIRTKRNVETGYGGMDYTPNTYKYGNRSSVES